LEGSAKNAIVTATGRVYTDCVWDVGQGRRLHEPALLARVVVTAQVEVDKAAGVL